MIIEMINIACLAFTIIGATILGHRKDAITGWYVYIVAAVLGVIYFVFTTNWIQMVLWMYFFINDIFAVMRKKKERRNVAVERLIFRFANPQDLPVMIDAADVSNKLSDEMIDFVNLWLEIRGMEVVEEDENEEPIVNAAGTNKGHGHVTMNFWFKKIDD